jgi:hypothetical protein
MSETADLPRRPDGEQTKSFRLRHSPEAVLAVFSETNEHLRNAEQKQLNITGAYLGMVAVVLSLLPGGAITLLAPRAESAFIYLFMFLVGCCVFLLQAWCRVWKEHYLKVIRQIAQTWLLPPELLPYWLRDIPDSPRKAFFRINIDNTLVYFTFVLNTLLLSLVCHQAVLLLDASLSYSLVLASSCAYALFLFAVHRLIENRRDVLRA